MASVKYRCCLVLALGATFATILSYSILTSIYTQDLQEADSNLFDHLPQQYEVNYYPPRQICDISLTKPHKVLNKQEVPEYYITVLVKSQPQNFKRRRTIRTTWGSVSTIGTKRIAVIFLIGKHQNETYGLKNEAEKFGDILQVNLLDIYENLPLKTLCTFQWLKENFKSRSKFFITTDDNCVINYLTTVHYLAKLPQQNPDIGIHCGYSFEKNAGVIRGHGTRSVSVRSYPYDVYPKFCRGGMVIMTYKFIDRVHEVATVTNFTGFPLEDVLIYGILRAKSGEPIKNVLNGGKPLVFHPWVNADSVINTMVAKWKAWRSQRIVLSKLKI